MVWVEGSVCVVLLLTVVSFLVQVASSSDGPLDGCCGAGLASSGSSIRLISDERGIDRERQWRILVATVLNLDKS